MTTIYTVPASEAQEFKRKARLVEVEWVENMNKLGFEGRKLLDTARSLTDKHGKAAAAPAKKARARTADRIKGLREEPFVFSN